MLPRYARVKLVSDRHRADGASAGMLGYIIELYPNGKYEVEFSNPDGTTIAQVVVDEGELALSPEGPG